MSDTEEPRDQDALEQPAADEPIAEDTGLLIIPGGAGPDDVDPGDLLGEVTSLQEAPEGDAEEVSPFETAAPAEPEQSEFTLDELVAEMAGVSSVTDSASHEAAPVVAERIDPLAAAMSDAFAEAPPVEAELWTRLPFWAIGGTWVLFVGALTYLLWPAAPQGLDGAPLYGWLVYGGAPLVALGLIVGMIVWTRARGRAASVDRPALGRVILLRSLGWSAIGVALWVVCMIVLSLHSLDVIP